MSPRTGRPKSDNPKSNRLDVRLTNQVLADLEYCSKELGVSKTRVVEIGIAKVKSDLAKK